MSDYTPDRWTVIRIHAPDQILYKVFASWSGGGFMGSDSWKLNSGIVRATLVDDYWEFDGSSGSVYRCHKDRYGTNGYGQAVLSNLLSQAKQQSIEIDVLDGETDWGNLQYEPLAQWVQSGVKND
jgi:hypothetical protein